MRYTKSHVYESTDELMNASMRSTRWAQSAGVSQLRNEKPYIPMDPLGMSEREKSTNGCSSPGEEVITNIWHWNFAHFFMTYNSVATCDSGHI